MFNIQEKLIFFPNKLPQNFQFKFPYNFEEISIPVGGAIINAIHFKAENSKGIIVYFHGNAGDLSSWGHVYSSFSSYSLDLLIIDYRGYGKSTGQIESQANFLKDGEAVYNYTKKLYTEDKIIVYGRSIGTGVATYIASKNKPLALILETPYSSLVSVIKKYYSFVPSFLVKYPLPLEEWIQNVTSDILLFHGEEDEIIPHNESLKIIKKVKSTYEFISIPNGMHNNLSNFTEYHTGLNHFFLRKIIK